MSRQPFSFGIPLIARASTDDWTMVETLLGLTVRSLLAQTDNDFRIVIAGHDRPALDLPPERIVFLEATWPAEAVRADNLDSGRKKWAINDHVLGHGGGLLMFVDADDWVDRQVVATGRAMLTGDVAGGFIAGGVITDLKALRAAPVPHPGVFDGGFHSICGSSNIMVLRPDHPVAARRDPYHLLHEHYRWEDVAAEHGLNVVPLPVSGSYVVNTSVNHSEGHGPFADWRRQLNASVQKVGAPLDDAFCGRFGLRLDDVTAASRIIAERALAC